MRTAKTDQADLSLRWAHMPFCRFCHEAAHFVDDGDKKLSYFESRTNIQIAVINIFHNLKL